MKYFDWKIDSEANDILWLRQHDDGRTKVVADYNSYWKLSEEIIDDIFNSPWCNELFNNQLILTDTCAGKTAIAEWEAMGCPTKEAKPYSLDFGGETPLLPPHVLRHIEQCGEGCITEEEEVAIFDIEEAA